MVHFPIVPCGKKRPTYAIGLTVICKIATGAVDDERDNFKSTGAQLAKLAGKKRAEHLPPKRRTEIVEMGIVKRRRT